MKIRLIFALGLLVVALLSCQGIRKQSGASGRSAVQIDEHAVLIPGTAIAGVPKKSARIDEADSAAGGARASPAISERRRR